MNQTNPPLISRAVYIFLAVFIGIFGVHDFYAKRVRAGIIHLCLMFAWILPIVASVLGVLGNTLYTLTYSPYRKEMHECKIQLKKCEQDIADIERKLFEESQKLHDALAGIIQKQSQSQPQPINSTRISTEREGPTKFSPTRDGLERISPKKEEELTQITPKIKIDTELVAELEKSIRELRNALENHERNRTYLKNELTRLPRQKSGLQILAWVNTGMSWLYLIFIILPLTSWVMAIFEIACVTKDGLGREFIF